MTADVVREAAATARLAADRLGLRVAALTEASSHHEAAAVLQQVWHADTPDAVMSAATMTALAHSGNYVVGVYRGETLVGAAVAFLGTGHLHSHLAGVLDQARVGGVGFALKQHQRAWALARGIDEVRWTFDPLVARNAYFNLHKLGAVAMEYLPDFYGALPDGINLGDPSDRLYAHWAVASPAVLAAAAGRPVGVDLAAVLRAGALVRVDHAGDRPVPAAAVPDDGRVLLVAVPSDIEGLRARDPDAAMAWRLAVRDCLGGGLAAGYRIAGMAREGFYVLQPKERE